MDDMNDNELLQEYALRNSEPAFDALVSRHINLVYSAALRHVGNPHQAEEITQAVFIVLAKKSRNLGPKTVLSGWLYQAARLTAANFRKGEIRRQRREQEAHMQSVLNETEIDAWAQIAPALDEAMAGLGEKDHNAVVLRFFENKNLRDVGVELGVTEDAAKMRVARALEKLRKFFVKRGVTLSAVAIGGAMAANSVQAAPVGLAATVAAMAAKGTAAASIAALVKGTMKIMTWLKIKFAVGAGATVLLAVGVAMVALSADSTSQTGKASEQQIPMLIVPGVGVGKVQKGMTTNEVELVLGKPDKWQGRIMVYDKKLGLSVGQTKTGAMVIFCGDSMLRYPGVKTFKGRTKEGIGMESSRADVIKAFGQPTTTKPWGAGQEQLEYKRLGLTFILESGKVINIEVDFRTAK